MRHTRRSRSYLFRAVYSGLLGFVLGAPILGCTDAPPRGAPAAVDPEVDTPAPPGAGGAGGEANAPPDRATSDRAGALFAALEPALVAACGGCHGEGGLANAPFLAGPDVYRSIVRWPGIVVKDYRASLLLEHPMRGGGHSGVNLDSDSYKETLLPDIVAWLEEEARGLAGEEGAAGPSLPPIAPALGFNVVPLDALGAPYRGMAITFDASELTDALLLVSDIAVHPTAQMGVRLVHPLFVVHPRGEGADPDPTDSFSGVDQVFFKGRSAVLGPGLAVLTNWRRAAELSIAFETIAPFAEGPGPGDACAALGAFIGSAQAPLSQRCGDCHGGGDAEATAALDMSGLQANLVEACAILKKWTNPDDPPASEIFITTDPAHKASHPFKFNADARLFSAFRDSVSLWISAER